METPFIPYGRQSISEEDIAAVVEVLRSDRVTQGPAVRTFERAIAEYCGARHAVAVSNGTAALHLAALAAGFGPGEEVITSPITFVASANCVLYAGARPVFADIDGDTLCIDPAEVRRQLTSKTRGIIPVHFAGRPCDMNALQSIAREEGLVVIEDAAHALGADYDIDGKTFKVGSCAHSDMAIFSFHPVKHITSGEGGAVTTNDEGLYRKLLSLRTHGITRDVSEMSRNDGPWYYEQRALGFNYRITDFQCALGRSQLKRLDDFVRRRREIVSAYNEAFVDEDELLIPDERVNGGSSWHIYVLQLKTLDRRLVFDVLREKGLGVNVHYIPVHLQPYYKKNFGFRDNDFPRAEAYYERAVTLPLYPGMSDSSVSAVIDTVISVIRELRT